jgi:NADH-quinone oxidoreductase subunit F
VCQAPCENRCRREAVDEAINMREVHRVIADAVLLSDRFDDMAARVVLRRRPPTGMRIAVAGAGPAGLTAAFYLALLGHEVTVYESHAEPGGMLRFALPEYRLPRNALDREIEIIRRLGVQFVFNTKVGADVQLDDLAGTCDAVFLSVGTWQEMGVDIPGNELKGVFPALPFLEAEASGKPAALGARVAVIGGGNAAIDCARTSLRKGAEVVVVYRRERKDMPAIAEEVDAAEEEGVRFVFLATPHRVIGERGAVTALEVTKTRLGEFDKSGRRRPIATGEIQVVACNSVILAVGEDVDKEFLRAMGLSLRSNGMLVVDRYSFETSRTNVYAGGDLVTGATNVTKAMAFGKDAARSIDARLMGEARFDALMPTFDYDQVPPPPPEPARRHHAHFLPAATRAKTFEEAVVALRPEEALEESCRCLRCDIRETAHHAVARR